MQWHKAELYCWQAMLPSISASLDEESGRARQKGDWNSWQFPSTIRFHKAHLRISWFCPRCNQATLKLLSKTSVSKPLSRFVWFAHHPALSPANGREARGTCCIGEGTVRISCRHGSATSSVDLCFWQMWRGNDISAFVIPSRGRT